MHLQILGTHSVVLWPGLSIPRERHHRGTRWKGSDPEITLQGTPYTGGTTGHFSSLCLSYLDISGKTQTLSRAEEAPGAILLLAQLPPLSSANPLRALLQDGLLTLPSHISVPSQTASSLPPCPPLRILLLTGPEIKSLGVSPA